MVRKTEKQSLKLPRGMGTMHYKKMVQLNISVY